MAVLAFDDSRGLLNMRAGLCTFCLSLGAETTRSSQNRMQRHSRKGRIQPNIHLCPKNDRHLINNGESK